MGPTGVDALLHARLIVAECITRCTRDAGDDGSGDLGLGASFRFSNDDAKSSPLSCWTPQWIATAILLALSVIALALCLVTLRVWMS